VLIALHSSKGQILRYIRAYISPIFACPFVISISTAHPDFGLLFSLYKVWFSMLSLSVIIPLSNPSQSVLLLHLTFTVIQFNQYCSVKLYLSTSVFFTEVILFVRSQWSVVVPHRHGLFDYKFLHIQE